jgi:hypothetical protein
MKHFQKLKEIITDRLTINLRMNDTTESDMEAKGIKEKIDACKSLDDIVEIIEEIGCCNTFEAYESIIFTLLDYLYGNKI